MRETTGYADETLASLSLDDLFVDADAVRAHVLDAGDGGSTFEAELEATDGDRFVYEFARTHLDAADTVTGPHVVYVGRDVTERVAREYRLQRDSVVLDALPDAAYAIGADETIAYVNEEYAAMKGVSRAELVGTDIDDWVDDETVGRADALRAEIDAGVREVAAIEYEFLTADGTRFPAELRFKRVGETEYDLGRVGIIRDVTERAERERQLQRQNDRLEEFAAIVSHDLRNPLNVAEGRLELARDAHDTEHLAAVADAHGRMRSLIDDLLALARQGQTAPELTAVSLAALAERCWDTVSASGATLSAETDATVRADEGQLQRLLENLFRNAVEHGLTDSRPRTDDSVAHGDGEVTVTVGDLPGGFFVGDDGPGIPATDRDRVFEAGYSTASDGTGFGLSIVDEVADTHGWVVTLADTDEGTGARFEIRGVTVV